MKVGQNKKHPAQPRMLGANPHGYQLWAAVGILHRLDRVFRRKSPHHQGQFAVSRRLDGKPIDPQHVLRSVSTAAVDFHNKFYIFHGSFQVFRSKGSSICRNSDSSRQAEENTMLRRANSEDMKSQKSCLLYLDIRLVRRHCQA